MSNESRAGSDNEWEDVPFQQLSEEDSRRLDSLYFYKVATRSQDDDAQSTRSRGLQHGSEASARRAATRSYEERYVGVEELATSSLVDLQYDVPSKRSHGEQILS